MYDGYKRREVYKRNVTTSVNLLETKTIALEKSKALGLNLSAYIRMLILKDNQK